MIIPLPNTTTREISKKLVEAQEHYTLTTGRVLTLIVAAREDDDLENILASVRDASHEHPSRVLVVVTGDPQADTHLDAQLRVGGEAGASEMVIMKLHGALANQDEAVVTPLLLPDTPLVAWWPTLCPPDPASSSVGKLAQRRITNVAMTDASLAKICAHYPPATRRAIPICPGPPSLCGAASWPPHWTAILTSPCSPSRWRALRATQHQTSRLDGSSIVWQSPSTAL